MTPIKLEKHLRESGFYQLRPCRHGWLWSDGRSQVLIPRGKGMSFRSATGLQNILSDIKRAVKLRKQIQESQNSTLTKDVAKNPTRRHGALILKKKAETEEVSVVKLPEPPSPEIEPPKEEIMSPTPPELAAQSQQEKILELVNGDPTAESLESPPTHGKKRRFDAAERFRIWERVKKGVDEDKGPAVITIEMRKEGFKMSNGDLLDIAYVRNTAREIRQSGLFTAKPVQETIKQWAQSQAISPAPAPAPPPQVIPQAVQVVAPPTQVPHRKGLLPDACVNILTDPDLTDRQKIKMLLAFVEG